MKIAILDKRPSRASAPFDDPPRTIRNMELVRGPDAITIRRDATVPVGHSACRFTFRPAAR